MDPCWIHYLTKLLAYTFFHEDISPSIIFVIQKHPNFQQFLPGKFQSSSGDMCALRDFLEIWQIWNVCIIVCYHNYFRIHLISLLLLLFIIIIYNSILCPRKQKEKGKRLHYLRCENSLLNRGNISMFNRA